jgi:hypothetical protein
MPVDAAPLNACIVSRADLDGYTREEIRFSSREGLHVFAYFLVPEETETPLPTLLCLQGHGYGVNAVAGLDEKGQPLSEPDYHNNFALQAVQRGYSALAIEILGFGRRNDSSHNPAPNETSCQTLSCAALMLGQSMAGWRVYDAIRAIDYWNYDLKSIPSASVSWASAVAA